MNELTVVIGLAVLCLVAAGLLPWLARTDSQRRRLAMGRLENVLARAELASAMPTTAGPRSWLPPVIESWLQRAGFTPSLRLYAMFAAPAPILAILGAVLFGAQGLLLGLLVIYPVALAMFMRWRVEHFHDQVVTQLPGFIDSVARILSIGTSMELAFRNASDECDEPMRGITAQMLLRARAGMAIEDAMNQVADAYRIRDLSFMASVFYLGVRYGGNARSVLERIAQSMRERERSQKELHAMTSETRASAWILSALPILVALLILVNQPNYLRGMWEDDLGHRLLLAAFGLQVFGMWLLFRMAKLRNR